MEQYQFIQALSQSIVSHSRCLSIGLVQGGGMIKSRGVKIDSVPRSCGFPFFITEEFERYLESYFQYVYTGKISAWRLPLRVPDVPPIATVEEAFQQYQNALAPIRSHVQAHHGLMVYLLLELEL